MNGKFSLGDLSRSGTGMRTRYRAPLSDENGVERYELAIAGPPDLIKSAFSAKATLEITVDPTPNKKVWSEHLANAWRAEREGQDTLARLEDFPGMFQRKKAPPAPAAKSSVFVSLRAIKPVGTMYFVSASGFTVPLGISLFFALPPVCSTFAVLAPASGDQDLFLHLAWPPLGPVRASVLGGTSVDAITFSVFCSPFTQFAPIWQVFGFRRGVCGTFAFGGTDIFG